jgi:signal transduction histidine kinase
VSFSRLRVLATASAAGAAAVSVAGIALAAAIPGYFGTYVDGHLLVNALLGLAYAIIGARIAWARPRNAIGWLFLLQGWFGGALAAIGEPYGLLALRGHHLPLAAWIAWTGGWSWAVAFVLGPTVVLTLWPSGHARGRLGVLVAVSSAVVAATTVLGAVLPKEMDPAVARLGQPVTWSGANALASVWPVVVIGCVAVCVVVAVVRLVRARSPEREQLGWYLVLSAASFACSVWLQGPVDAVVQPPLILAMGWALLWYGLFDLRLALRRTLVYGVLTGCVAVIYALVTGVLSTRMRPGPGPALAAAAIVSVGLLPLRDVLQRAAGRLVYGQPRDPALAVARVGQDLRRPGADVLSTVAVAVAEALQSPYVAIEDQQGNVAAAFGQPSAGPQHTEPLDYQGETHGRLVVQPRTRGEPLDRDDLRVVRALAPHVALATRAVELTAEVERSRGQVVAASLAERDRLRRDLHDGMGPALGGLALSLEAAQSLLGTDPARAAEILARARDEADRAVVEVRRIIDDLRPDVLDRAGLAGALREYADLLNARGSLTVDLDLTGLGDPAPGDAGTDADRDGVSGTGSPDGAPAIRPAAAFVPIDPAVEVAAYRISQEAITNVVRHSGATRCAVRLTGADAVTIEVSDNGTGIEAIRQDGLGLDSIRQRAESCGGTMIVTSSPAGTCLTVTLPGQRQP